VACRIAVEVRLAHGQTVAARTLDLTLGGACLEMQAPLVVGHRVQLRLDLPGAPSPVAAEGDVRWVRDLSSGLYVAGLSLLALPTGDAALLREFLDGIA
jgi:hypothetical protein